MYDAIIIPGGGVRDGGTLPDWVQRRFDLALSRWQGDYLICLSAGTTYKPLPRDTQGYPLFESVAGAHYLLSRGVPATKILTETASYDTIGNAYFARTLHTDPLGLRRLLVVTSAFHMPRTRAIFEWVFGLSVTNPPYTLEFAAASDEGLDPAMLRVRHAKEAEGLQRLLPLTQHIRTLPDLHRFLFTQHDAYAVARFTYTRPTAEKSVRDMY